MIVPWRDRHGRFLPLKAAVLFAGCIPGAVLAFWWASGALGGRPVTEVIHGTGDWAIRFLLITLAITPAARVLNWPRILLVRRIVGLTALAYAVTHLCLYVVDQNYNLLVVVSEIFRRFYLTIGFVTLLGLGVLGTTSTDGWTQAARTLVEAAAQSGLRARRRGAAALLHPVEVERVGASVHVRRVRMAHAVAHAADGLAAQPDRTAGTERGRGVRRGRHRIRSGMRWRPGSTRGVCWRQARRFDFGLRPAHYVALAGLAVPLLAGLRQVLACWARSRGWVTLSLRGAQRRGNPHDRTRTSCDRCATGAWVYLRACLTGQAHRTVPRRPCGSIPGDPSL